MRLILRNSCQYLNMQEHASMIGFTISSCVKLAYFNTLILIQEAKSFYQNLSPIRILANLDLSSRFIILQSAILSNGG